MDGDERLAAFQAVEAYEQAKLYEEMRVRALDADRVAAAAKEREVEAKEREVVAKALEVERIQAWEAAKALSIAAKEVAAQEALAVEREALARQEEERRLREEALAREEEEVRRRANDESLPLALTPTLTLALEPYLEP